MCWLLHQLDVNGWEKPRAPLTLSLPPALVDHLDVSDDVIRVEGDLVVSLCEGGQKMERFDPQTQGRGWGWGGVAG